MGSWVHDKVHVKSLDFFEPCAKAAKTGKSKSEISTPRSYDDQLSEFRCDDSVHIFGTVSYTHLTLPTIYSV